VQKPYERWIELGQEPHLSICLHVLIVGLQMDEESVARGLTPIVLDHQGTHILLVPDACLLVHIGQHTAM